MRSSLVMPFFRFQAEASGITLASVTLTLAGLSWGSTAALTGFVPGVTIRGSTGVVLSLWIIRFLFGTGEAATFRVAARSVQGWKVFEQRLNAPE